VTNRRDFMRYAAVATLITGSPGSVLGAHHEKLLSRKIPGTEESLPVIGLGNASIFRDDDLTAARELINLFLDRGGRYIDAGGSSRFNVGRVLRELNAANGAFVGNYLDATDAQAMRAEARAVAEGQGKTALDLVHTRDVSAYREHIDHYRQLKDEGLVRYIGVARSGEQSFPAVTRLIEDGLVDFVQVNYSMMEPLAADRLLPTALDNGVAVNVNRPFINGHYFGIVKGQVLPAWAAEFDCESWAQFSLKYILAHPAINCVLTETSNPQHALDNLGAGLGRLPDEKTRQRMQSVIRELM